MSDQPFLSAEALAKRFDDGAMAVDVLRGITLSVARGETLAIIGASGSGKSTLLHLLGGLDQPTAGRVMLDGADLAAMNERRRCAARNRALGFIYQFHHLLPEFNALENIAMPLLIGGVAMDEALERAAAILAAMGLAARGRHRPAELSGGERQRAAIGRALVTEPGCVLADEPTGNLDGRNALQAMDLMLAQQARCGSSLVVVTHDLEVAARMDRIARLDDGRLVDAEL